MPFLIYFFVLLVSAASVLFGLDLITSPLPKTPNVPIGRSVQMVETPPAPAVKQEAKAQAQLQARNTAANERALTPVYPASRGRAKEQAATSGAATPDQAALTPPPAEPKVVEQSAVETKPAAQQPANRCNVQACAGAYRSFRASDCTYQRFDGARRFCTVTARAAAGRTIASKPRNSAPMNLNPQQAARQPAGKDEMSDIERIVRHMTRNEDGDIPVQDADGRIIIVRKSYSYR